MRYEYPAARMRYRGATLRLYQPCGGASVYEPAESHPPYKSAGGGIKHHALSRTAAAPHPHRYPSPPPPPGINFCIVRQRRHFLRQAKQAVSPVKIPKVTLQPHEAACHRRGQNVPNRYAILLILLNAPSQPHRPQVPAVIRLVRQINRMFISFLHPPARLRQNRLYPLVLRLLGNPFRALLRTLVFHRFSSRIFLRDAPPPKIN